MTMDKGISIIICCYNSSLRLPATIAHIARQKTRHDLAWEIIIVNNSSTDDTLIVAHTELEKHKDKINYHLINENKAGLIHARHTGVSKAKYEYIVFCDDDNWLCETYINTVFNLLEQNPVLGAVGGQGEVESDGLIPDWFEEYKFGYAVGMQTKQTGDITSRGYLWGAGLGTRKSLYLHIYKDFPSFLIGRTTKKLSSGEDTEYCLRLILRGYQLYYDSDLVYKHFIIKERLTLTYREKLLQGFKEAEFILDKYYLAVKLKPLIGVISVGSIKLFTKALFKYIFTFSNLKKEKSKNTLFLLSPFKSKVDPITSIKNFINKVDC